MFKQLPIAELKFQFLIILFFTFSFLKAQNSNKITNNFDDTLVLPEVKILLQSPNFSFQNQIEKTENNITNQISQNPGIYSFNMGEGNNKPILRGFSGNRIAIIVDGLKLDNQQWQDEHGLALTAFDNDQISINLGNCSSYLGSDAFGGAIIIGQDLNFNTIKKLNLQYNSNNSNISTSYQLQQKRKTNSSWLNLKFYQQSDYKDAENNYAINSRNRGFQGKIGKVTTTNNRTTITNYRIALSQVGIARLFDSIEKSEIKQSEPYDFEGPNHLVGIQTFAKNIIIKKTNGTLNAGIGIISNTRLELENNELEGLGIQLSTLQHNLLRTFKDQFNVNHNLSQRIICQNNYNFGLNHVIPNANCINYSIADILHKNFHKIQFTQGIGIDYNFIGNNEIKSKLHFLKVNVNSSIKFQISKKTATNINASFGNRIPNLHEFFANGMSEDAYRFDLGNSKLNPEQIKQLEWTLNYQSKKFSFQSNVFYNHINNFISLLPNNNKFNDMPIYEYKQFNSKCWGTELKFIYHSFNQKLNFSSAFSEIHIQSKVEETIIYLPPNKLTTQIEFIPIKDIKLKFEHVFFNNTSPQNNLENKYKKVNLINFKVVCTNKKIDYFLQIKNLTNSFYVDPLSMLKIVPYFAIGRDIQLGFTYNFL